MLDTTCKMEASHSALAGSLVRGALVVIMAFHGKFRLRGPSYLPYRLASTAWSDERTVLMKRWVKDLGNPIMALAILTERRPYEAVGVVLRRLTFRLRPLSCSSNITPSLVCRHCCPVALGDLLAF
jgi:hypothetical protein